jgi:hypothetical protein
VAILFSCIVVQMLIESSSAFDYRELGKVQVEAGNFSYLLPTIDGKETADIMNATEDLRPKISQGGYESTKYDIPVGPYEVSFEARTPQKAFGVSYFTWNETVGSGKTYHTAYFEQYPLYVADGDGHGLDIYITRYIGPSKFPPSEPEEYRNPSTPKNWDFTFLYDETIDGHAGSKYGLYHKTKFIRYYYYYELNPSTFVTIESNMPTDKDLDLAIETLHIDITKK